LTALPPTVLADAFDWQETPAPRTGRWPAALSAALHAGLVAAALLVLHPEPQTLDLAGSSIMVELIAAETLSSDADAAESDAAVDMVSAGGEQGAQVTSEPVEPVAPVKVIEPIETVENAEPAQPEPMEATPEMAEPVLAAPAAALAAEALPPVEAAAPVPLPRTKKQQPIEAPKKSASQRPLQAGNGGNSAADAKASAPAGGPKVTDQNGNGAAVTKYPGHVLAKLRRALRYPSGGRGTGEVSVQFTVTAAGGVSGVRVVRSSGNPVFDKAAMETVRRAAPFPPIPPEAGRSTWTFTMPLGFVR
jgi:protein TonB